MQQEYDTDLKHLKEELPHMDITEVRSMLQKTDRQTHPEQYALLKDHLYEMEEIREGLSERKETPPHKYPQFKNAVVLLLVLIFFQLAVTSTFTWLLKRAGVRIDTRIDLAVAGFANLVAFAAVTLYGLRRTDANGKNTLCLNSFSVSLFLPVFISVVGLSIIGSEIDNLIRHIFPPPEMIENIMRDVAGAGIVSLVTLVVVAPLTEEFLFRGLFLRGFVRNYGAKAAIFTSAFLFAVVHLNPYQMIPAFLAGLFLGWLTLGSGSVWPAVIAHAATNGLLVLISRLGTDIPGVIQRAQPEYQPLWLDGIGVVLLMTGILWLGAFFHRKERKIEEFA